MRLLPLLLLVLLTACGGGGGDDAGGGVQPAPSDDALTDEGVLNELVVVQDLGDGSEPQDWTLRCDGDSPSGSHPQPEAACEHLVAIENPFAPLPTDLLCTEVYGGPQTALVSGVWNGEPVDLELSRRNGCEISQWDSLGPLLPGPVGVPQ